MSSGELLTRVMDDDDVIEKEKALRLPLHKRLEFVAGFDIHQLVKDARQKRHMLHTRDGFYLSTSPSVMATLFQKAPSRAKSSRRSGASAKSTWSSKNSTVTSLAQSEAAPLDSVDVLHFCSVHGRNVVLSADRRSASRSHDSFCEGIVIAHRPLRVGEKINIKLDKVRRDWRGGFKLGFTSRDPARIDPDSLPSYTVPDMSRSSRFWVVPVQERYAAKNNVFSFTLQDDGRVIYFINNQNKGVFLKGLDSRQHWFPLIDLYGRVAQISIVDQNSAENADFAEENSDDEDRQHSASVATKSQTCCFHSHCGRNIRMDSRRRVAKRVDSFWNSLTFLSDPIRPHDVLYIEISKANTSYAGTLGVGVTNVDPSTIDILDLPDNADLLTKNMSQYWQLSRDIETNQGDQLGFEMNESGHVFYSKNGEPSVFHMYADVSMRALWFALDVYGSTTMIRLLGIIKAFDPSKSEGFSLAIDDVAGSEEDSECLMCYKTERVRNCAIQPCGHLTLCCWCAITCLVKQTLRFIVCPICGGPVCDVIKILNCKSD